MSWKDKVLEIEEKEDNHIAYLEAQLEGLSPFGEDEKVEDEPKGKGAKVWMELGHESSQPTMPPLTPVVPSTRQAGRYYRFSSLHGSKT